MANANTFRIVAASKEVYEVEKSEDGTKVTFRLAANPKKNFGSMYFTQASITMLARNICIAIFGSSIFFGTIGS